MKTKLLTCLWVLSLSVGVAFASYTNPTVGSLIYWSEGSGGTAVGVATSSATCTGFITCTGFTVVGSGAPAITTTGSLSVGSGGTGVASFGQGWINSSGGTANLGASTSPTVNYLYATSTIATSTLQNLQVNGLLIMGSAVPTISTSTGSGTVAATTTIRGTAEDVNINLITGSNPAINTTIFTVTLPSGKSCPNNIIPVISPANSASAQISSSTRNVFASSTSANIFTITSGGLGLISTTTYLWNIHIGCY